MNEWVVLQAPRFPLVFVVVTANNSQSNSQSSGRNSQSNSQSCVVTRGNANRTANHVVVTIRNVTILSPLTPWVGFTFNPGGFNPLALTGRLRLWPLTILVAIGNVVIKAPKECWQEGMPSLHEDRRMRLWPQVSVRSPSSKGQGAENAKCRSHFAWSEVASGSKA